MKILYISPWAFSTSYYAAKICNQLSALGISVILVSPQNFLPGLLDRSIRWEPWPFTAPDQTRWWDVFSLFGQAVFTWRAIRRLKPDLVHTLWIHPLPLLLAPFLRGLPLAYTAHDPWLHSGEAGRLREWIQTRLVHQAHLLFVHGAVNQQMLLERYAVEPKKVHSIPLSEYGFWELNTPREAENVILFFGRIRQYKGLAVFLEAIERIQDQIPDYRYLICGAGDVGDLLDRIQRNPRITLINRFIDHEEVPVIFGRSKFLVLPYLDATQSGVISMALGLGRTCIASEVGAIPEVVRHEVNGLLVPPGDVGALASAMLRLAKDGELCRRLTHQANLTFTQSRQISWARSAEIASQAYQSVLQGEL